MSFALPIEVKVGALLPVSVGQGLTLHFTVSRICPACATVPDCDCTWIVYVPGGVLAIRGLVSNLVPPHPTNSAANIVSPTRLRRFFPEPWTRTPLKTTGSNPKASPGYKLGLRVSMLDTVAD